MLIVSENVAEYAGTLSVSPFLAALRHYFSLTLQMLSYKGRQENLEYHQGQHSRGVSSQGKRNLFLHFWMISAIYVFK